MTSLQIENQIERPIKVYLINTMGTPTHNTDIGVGQSASLQAAKNSVWMALDPYQQIVPLNDNCQYKKKNAPENLTASFGV